MKCENCINWACYATIYDDNLEPYDIGECWPPNCEFKNRKCGVRANDKICDKFVEWKPGDRRII